MHLLHTIDVDFPDCKCLCHNPLFNIKVLFYTLRPQKSLCYNINTDDAIFNQFTFPICSVSKITLAVMDEGPLQLVSDSQSENEASENKA